MIQIDTTKHGESTVLTVTGELTIGHEQEFIRVVVASFDQGARRVVLDLSGVTYVSSAGLGALVRVTAQANSQGQRLCIANPSMFVGEVISTTRLDKFFEVFPTVAAAVAAA